MRKKRDEIENHDSDQPQRERAVIAVGLYSTNTILTADGRRVRMWGESKPSPVAASRGYSRGYRY